jgi:hypothetical protein
MEPNGCLGWGVPSDPILTGGGDALNAGTGEKTATRCRRDRDRLICSLRGHNDIG